jgi:membrane fusion protein (multidrug efflux system)
MYAPIDGEISRNLVDVGNFVGDGQTTLLATIVKTDPIYAYISVSEADVLRFKELVRQGKREDYRTADMPIELGLSNETGFPHEGKIQYADPGVDPGTGTVRARGIFPNPKGILDPGMFVRVRVPFEHRDNALLVPERALGADQGGRYLLVLDKENVVERRSVTVGTEVGDLRVVDGKIGPNDRVVIDGLQRARPGLKVHPKPAADVKPASEPAVAESKPAPNRAS